MSSAKDEPPGSDGKPDPGSTVPQAADGVPADELRKCWGHSGGEEFNVRAAGYKKQGKKEPSLSAFYDLAALDFVKSSSVVEHVAQLVELSRLPQSAEHEDLPPVFIVNCQLPDGEPSMFGGSDNGPGRSAIFYFTLKHETAEALRAGSLSPALGLVREYFSKAPTDDAFRGRFKVIAAVKNMEALDLPGFISNYNGKPVLITKSGSLFRGDGYAEMDIRVHRFSYLARKGLNFLQGRFAQMVFDVGFVIEGREDAELPEQMLGAARFFRLDYEGAVELFR